MFDGLHINDKTKPFKVWNCFSGSSDEPTPGKYNKQHFMTFPVRYYIDNGVSLSSSLLPLICVCYVLVEPHPRRYKCGLSAPCPPKHLAFRLVSGAANVIGPKICLEDKMWDSVFPAPLCLRVSLSPLLYFFVLFFHTLLIFSLYAMITRPPSLSGNWMQVLF